MKFTEIANVIGIASVVSIVVSFVFDSLKTRIDLKFERLFSVKEDRYRSMLVFMSVLVDEKNIDHISTTYKPTSNENIKEYYEREINLHLSFFTLFAGDVVIQLIKEFLDNPTEIAYQNVANEMRKDLWSKKLKM